MRKLRLIRMTLLMVIVCTSFCACSSNDDDDNGDVKVEEKTVTVNLVEGSSDKLTDNLLIYKLTSNDEAKVIGNNGEVVSVVIPTKIVWGGNTYKVTKIEDKAFYELGTLTSVTIPSSIKTIGDWAFSGCYNLTTVIIANGVTTIGEAAFEACDITSVTIPNSVTIIECDAFENCDLTSITIPNSVTTIESEAFLNCEHLSSITIVSGMTSIESDVFYECNNIKNIYLKSTTPPTNKRDGYSFFYNYSATLHVPSGCKAIYSKTYPWSEFKNIVES
jgi:hypothetical protein